MPEQKELSCHGPRPRVEKTSALPGRFTLDAYFRRITLRMPPFHGLCAVGRFGDLLHLTDGSAPPASTWPFLESPRIHRGTQDAYPAPRGVGFHPIFGKLGVVSSVAPWQLPWPGAAAA